MKRLILFLVAFNFVAISYAHNPNTASVVYSSINGIWMVQFSISQNGANAALAQYYTDIKLNESTAEEFKKLYVNYIKSKVSLMIDDQLIQLASGGIKLGNHQTDIKFILPDFPTEFKTVDLTLPLFEENTEQNTVVKFEQQGKSIRKVLNQDNNFKLSFKNSESAFEEVESNKSLSLYIYSALTILGTLVFTVILFRKLKA